MKVRQFTNNSMKYLFSNAANMADLLLWLRFGEAYVKQTEQDRQRQEKQLTQGKADGLRAHQDRETTVREDRVGRTVTVMADS